MPAYTVKKTIAIQSKQQAIHEVLTDFNTWPKWSPWLSMESDASLEFAGTPGQSGHRYQWDGQLVGKGELELIEVKDQCINLQLRITKPFKSESQVCFKLNDQGEQTQVTWQMDSKLPFFLFFMVDQLKTMIGCDYERGLGMLKELIETGNVLSKTQVVGIVDVQAIDYIGKSAQCPLAQIGEQMPQTMCDIHQCMQAENIQTAGSPGTIYSKFDLKNEICQYISFFPTQNLISESQALQAKGMYSATIDSCKAIKVIHTGSYQHLGNAWGAAMSYQRYNKHKLLKKQPGFELYLSDPENTPQGEIITEVYVPIA